MKYGHCVLCLNQELGQICIQQFVFSALLCLSTDIFFALDTGKHHKIMTNKKEVEEIFCVCVGIDYLSLILR